jgi:hypothetical protein
VTLTTEELAERWRTVTREDFYALLHRIDSFDVDLADAYRRGYQAGAAEATMIERPTSIAAKFFRGET